jgi:regulator of protease activity HflC (stomatin/prohibitin superfamily)
MSNQPINVSFSPSSRNLNNVQRVQRTMIWFGIFFLMGILTTLITLILWSIWAPLGVGALIIGGLLSLIVPGMFSSCLYILSEFDRVVVLKLGKFVGVRGPGRFWVIPYPPFNESVAAQVDNRIHTRMIKAAETLTADNVPVGCEAVVFWRVEEPKKAALTVTDYHEAIFQAANSALKDTIGSLELSELLGERDKIAETLERIIDKAAADFGVDITSVEITDVRVPADLVQELSVLAQSRRSAQAKVAEAEAEKAIAEKLDEAASLMSDRAMDMYRLNVLERLGREEGSQVVIYGMGSRNATLEQSIVGGVAGNRVPKDFSKSKPTSGG